VKKLRGTGARAIEMTKHATQRVEGEEGRDFGQYNKELFLSYLLAYILNF
jgi:hypothetical protein